MCYEIFDLREGSTDDYITVSLIHEDYPDDVFSLEVGQVPYCCGATLICGLNQDFTDAPTDAIEAATHAMLTDFDRWKSRACYFAHTGNREAILAGLLTRCKLIVVDAVGGESDMCGSLSRMAQRFDGWEMAGKPTENANSGNMIAIYEYNQEGIDQL